ncbi:LuxR C-terminal-related transcriptional regulator [Rhodococcus sp. NPDC059968]|uniref:helix-turn-helix transcriptional regulator n=1 Tax=Rhodococcus sp. NPDC059968 TaxID=3347017 RepID=UPI003671509F
MISETVPCHHAPERAELDQLLERARSGTAVVALVEGVPGVGKSTLVSGLFQRWPEWCVRIATAAEWRHTRTWDVTGQLLRAPVSYTDPVDAAASFSALASRPTVLVIDDAHWADIESLRALTVAVQHPGCPLVVLMVVSDPLPDGVPPETVALFAQYRPRTVRVRSLTPDNIARLALSHIGVELSPFTARQLYDHTLGQPRPVLQLLAEIPRDRWHRWQGRFPATREHAAAVRRALARCSADARALAQASAVLGTECPLPTAAELARLRDPTSAMEALHNAGLLRMRAQPGVITLVFPDPMTQAAVADELGPARWRTLHERAVTLVDNEGAALHHAASAAPLPDEDLAARLDRYAEVRAGVGAWSDAATSLITASRISPGADNRADRLIRGVDALIGAALLPRALTFLSDVEAAPPGPMRSAVLGYLAIQRGRRAEANQTLICAWDALGDPADDTATAAMICQRMVLHSLAALRSDDIVMWADRAASLVDSSTPAAIESEAIRGLGLAMSGRVGEAKPAYARLAQRIRLGEQRQRVGMAEGWLALALDDPESARAELERAECTNHRGGSLRISLWAQAWLARTYFVLGDWDDALRTVDRAAMQLDTAGVDLLRPLVHWTGAQIHALRGNWPASREHLRRGRAGNNDYAIMLVPARIAMAQYAEASADYVSVLRHLQALEQVDQRHALNEPGFWPWVDMYANALIMTGRVDEADAFLQPHERLATERNHRSTTARLRTMRGRIAGARGEIDTAIDAFDAALENLAALSMPYEQARVNFVYGQTLRRAGRRRDADAVMRSARELYILLGATEYARRCDRELRAGGLGGGTRRGEIVTSRMVLTPQEGAVARLVASGKRNKEVADEMFVSVKTVQYHLTRIYAKLGIRSRSELAAHLPLHPLAVADYALPRS